MFNNVAGVCDADAQIVDWPHLLAERSHRIYCDT